MPQDGSAFSNPVERRLVCAARQTSGSRPSRIEFALRRGVALDLEVHAAEPGRRGPGCFMLMGGTEERGRQAETEHSDRRGKDLSLQFHRIPLDCSKWFTQGRRPSAASIDESFCAATWHRGKLVKNDLRERPQSGTLRGGIVGPGSAKSCQSVMRTVIPFWHSRGVNIPQSRDVVPRTSILG